MFIDETIGLSHMLDAAKEAVFLARNRQKTDLQINRILASSMVECLELIVEAAVNISPERQAQLSGIPWQKIISIRTYLNQTDFEINLDIIWEIVTKDLPLWINHLDSILANDQKGFRSHCDLGGSPSKEATAVSRCGLGENPHEQLANHERVLGSPQVEKPVRSWGLPK